MAIIEKSDLIGGTISDSLDAGVTATRIFLVTGLSGTAESKMKTALELSGIPKLKELHPAFKNEGKVKVESKDARALSNNQVEVTVNYAKIVDEDSNKISLGSTVQLERTNFAFTFRGAKSFLGRDKQIILKHTFREDDKQTGESIIRDEFQTAEVDIQEPNATAVFRSKKKFNVKQVLVLFDQVGTVNEGPFLEDSVEEGSDKLLWLCTGISAESNDGGEFFDMTFEFQQKKQGWDATVIFIDPTTDRPVKDPDEGKLGEASLVKNVIMYRSTDFTKFGLKPPTQ